MRPRLTILLLLLLMACADSEPPPVPADPARGSGGYDAVLWCFTGEVPETNLLRRLGVTAINVGGGESPDEVGEAGLRHYVGQVAGGKELHFRKMPEHEERPIRPFCLSDPEVVSKLLERVDASVAMHRAAKPIGYALGDEVSLTRGANPVDYCFGPHCLRRMREWLRSRYGSLEALNAAWGTDFKSFDAVRPLGTGEIRRREYGKPRLVWNLAPWADHRAFMDDVMAGVVARFVSRVNELDPKAPVGLLGAPFPGAFGGHDFSRLLPRQSFYEVYDIRGTKALARSLAPPGALAVTTVFPSGGEERVARYLLFRNFALGDRGSVIWSNREFVEEGMPTDYARWLSPVLRELTGPLGGALEGATPADDGVAVYYSPASVRVGWMIDSEEDRDTWPRRLTSYEADHSSVLLSRQAVQKVLEDMGIGYRFVSSAQVEAGALRKGGIRALLLPKVLALSEAEAAEIAAFAAGGGAVVADFAAGLFDELGRGRGLGRLDALFGVSREDGRARERGGRPDAPVWCVHRGLPVMEPSLRLAGAKAEVELGGAPAVVRRVVGKGFAVYLNLGLAGYPETRLGKRGGAELRELLAGFLQEAGIRPRFPVLSGRGGRLERILVLSYRRGEEEVLAVLRNYGVRTGSGGKAELAGTGGLSVSRIRIVLPGPRTVTNLRTGQDYGEVAMIEDHLMPLEANLYLLR